MKKFTLFLIPFLVFSLTYGQEVSLVELTAQTLSVSEPSLLPNSPFYFLKELSRNVQKIFIFDDVKKIDFELRILDEKLLETKKLVERNPNQIEALKKALENYKSQVSLLEKRLERIKEKTNNENLKKVIESILDRSIKHQILIEDVILKIENNNELKNSIEALKLEKEKLIVNLPSKIENQENFPEVLNNVVEKQLNEQNNNPALGLKIYSIVNDLQEKIPVNKPEVGQKIDEIKLKVVNETILPNFEKEKSFDSKVESNQEIDLENMLLKDVLEKLPVEKRVRILAEIKEIVKNQKEVIQNKEKVRTREQEVVRNEQLQDSSFKPVKDDSRVLMKIEQIERKVILPEPEKEKGQDVKYIVVTQPSNLVDQAYKVGSNMEIKWRSLNVARVKIYLCDTQTNFCSLMGNIPDNGIANKNYFNFYLDPNHPYFPLESGRIKVVDASNENIYGFSGYFSVVKEGVVNRYIRNLKILEIEELKKGGGILPGQAATFKVGDYITLKWESENIDKVAIRFCKFNPAPPVDVHNPTDGFRCELIKDIPNKNTYRFYIDPKYSYHPVYSPVEASISVSFLEKEGLYKFENSVNFWLITRPGVKSLKVQSPNSQQNLIAGTYLDLKWSSVNVKKVKIYLCDVRLSLPVSDRENCKLVVPESGIFNSDSYRLYLDPNHPYFPLENGRIRIEDAEDKNVFDYTPFIKVRLLSDNEVKEERMTTTVPHNVPPLDRKADFRTE